MLDSTTKSRIDSARDILVGKVPDPKSQVEQITIALIYKFMDDMDRQSEELGGKATFFTGEFKKYRWAQLLDKRYSGHERLLLYAEGIEKMNENKNIPQLFRDIFKGVFLPYRDPETLNLFLKEINGFSYDHSERLGDAFEYLLSVLGTQGDAGQFRTPRHIIDFIVAVVNPKKTDTILDPACGTAGFLISAYKHILGGPCTRACGGPRSVVADSDEGGRDKARPSSALTPDQRARLMTNFRGYDIAPDMVRLARANLYLHGFPSPTIHEYDTLTSEERWDERYEVILANPPFMTPKGGIRPHNRFSIKAKRSEVLFVDYIAEHLSPGGRAGIIVPEGIIFQSQNAYKQLRKMLVENYLWAVVSLPAGVFNPYSGVKTSILFLDRNLARQRDDVLFVKIENDGFDLGAQRRPMEVSDLPAALRLLSRFLEGHAPSWPIPEADATKRVPPFLTVLRARLLESPDINLSGDRYRAPVARHSGKWPMVKLGEVCSLEYGTSLPERSRLPGPYPVVGSNGVTGLHRKFTVKGPVIVVGRKGSAGEVNWVEQDCTPIDTTYHVLLKRDGIALRYLFYAFQQLSLTELRGGAGVPGLNRNDVYEKELPLPPLDEQERIVAELEGYRKVIEGARQILAAYKPTIRIDPAWPMVRLGEIGRISMCRRVFKEQTKNRGDIPFYKIGTFGKEPDAYIDRKLFEEYRSKYPYPKKGAILLSASGTIGKTVVYDGVPAYFQDSNIVWCDNDETLMINEYLYYVFQMTDWATTKGVTIERLYCKHIEESQIPLPPLAVQRQIVAELEAERKLVEANRELIARMETKIQAKLAEVWGETEN